MSTEKLKKINENDESKWLQSYSLLYRLGDQGRGSYELGIIDEINITKANGSRDLEARIAVATKLREMLEACQQVEKQEQDSMDIEKPQP